MLMGKVKQSEIWQDGIINVLNASDGVIESNKINDIKFGERTVGINRFYKAMVAGKEVEAVVSIPFGVDIHSKDMVEVKTFGNSTIGDGIYQVLQVQMKDTTPRSLYVTLHKGDVEYDDKRKV